MRKFVPTTIACTLVLGSALAFAQSAGGPGIHVIELPKASTGAKQVMPTTLLETPHLKLVTIVVPKGGALAAHSKAGRVSIQTLSGSGELRMAQRTERLQVARLIVLAPGTQHDVRAGADGDLVLLVHELAAGPGATGPGAGRGPGMGPGMGHGMGPGRGTGMGAGPRRGASASPEAGTSKK